MPKSCGDGPSDVTETPQSGERPRPPPVPAATSSPVQKTTVVVPKKGELRTLITCSLNDVIVNVLACGQGKLASISFAKLGTKFEALVNTTTSTCHLYILMLLHFK